VAILGKGVSFELKDNLLCIEIDTSQDFGLSGSGKSNIIASSSGNKAIEVDGRTIYLGLNLYEKV
jgi:hypothetical protein|tara:strand:+ start:76 stop:270 length:195 start_codon:yes stop_codon:yes gene_type:complete